MSSVRGISDCSLLQLILDWFAMSDHAPSERDFLDRSLHRLQMEIRAEAVAWVANLRGTWQVEASAGNFPGLAADFYASAADSEVPVRQGNWFAMPVTGPTTVALLLVSHRTPDTFANGIALLARILAWLRGRVRRQHQSESRLALGTALDRLLARDPVSKAVAPKLLALIEQHICHAVHGDWATFESASGASDAVARADRQPTLTLPLGPSNKPASAWLRLGRALPWPVEDEQFLTAWLDALQPLVLASLAAVAAPPVVPAAQWIGESPVMAELRKKIARVADSDLTVLVRGENGTGKEIVSREIHAQSARRSGPLQIVNCAALTETLLESELFGFERGAFTDAKESRAGKFELAHSGTLFLDEVAELTPRGQAQLLRVLEEKTVVRIGGHTPIPVDTRLVAATSRDLAEMVQAGTFRRDLFFRLNVVVLQLPPLRERAEDIPLLANHFLALAAQQKGSPKPQWTSSALQALMAYPWPGNVRELRNLMMRLCFLYDDDPLDVHHLQLPSAPIATPWSVESGLSLAEATRQFQIAYIEHHFQGSAGRMTEIADRLGLHRTNLYRKMKQLGMTPPG